MAKKPQPMKGAESANKKPATKRPPQRRQVKLHPEDNRTLLSGRQKTMEFTVDYKSDLMNRFLTDNGRRLLNTFERLAAIYRMATSDRAAYDKIKNWHQDVNLAIANEQLETLEEQREQTITDLDLDIPEIHIPSAYNVKFEVSHPVTHTVINLVRAVDVELNEIESIFLSGGIDDLQYESARRQALSILNGVIDRILKVTSPGRREGGSFSKELYMKFLKDPKFDLIEKTDMPLDIRQKLGFISESEVKAVEEKAVTEKKIKAEPKPKPKASPKRAAKTGKAKKTAKEQPAAQAEVA